jgi:hypothetical protein
METIIMKLNKTIGFIDYAFKVSFFDKMIIKLNDVLFLRTLRLKYNFLKYIN